MKKFSDLRSQSKDIEKVQKALAGSKKTYEDDRFWLAALDKTKCGRAIIRFLPPPPNEDLAEVLLYSHFFQGPGGYYVENCPTTLGHNTCPVCKDNGVHINGPAGKEAGLKFVRERKSSRQQSYIANILIVNDFANPENNGQVRLFKYGPQLHKIYADAIKPELAGIEAYLPYDFWEGADFDLRITQKKVAGQEKSFANFETSRFMNRAKLERTEEQLEAIWNQEHSLKDFISPDKFKSEAELKAKLETILGETLVYEEGSGVLGQSLEDQLKTMSATKLKTLSAPKEKTVEQETKSEEVLNTSDLETINDVANLGNPNSIESLRNLIK